MNIETIYIRVCNTFEFKKNTQSGDVWAGRLGVLQPWRLTRMDSWDLQEYDGEFKLDGGWLIRGVSSFTSFGIFIEF